MRQTRMSNAKPMHSLELLRIGTIWKVSKCYWAVGISVSLLKETMLRITSIFEQKKIELLDPRIPTPCSVEIAFCISEIIFCILWMYLYYWIFAIFKRRGNLAAKACYIWKCLQHFQSSGKTNDRRLCIKTWFSSNLWFWN